MQTLHVLLLLPLATAFSAASVARPPVPTNGARRACVALQATPDVVIDKDFRLGAIFLGTGLLLDTIPYLQVSIGPIATLLGVLFLVQTVRLDFTFDSDSFELKGLDGADTGENIVVGGANRWSYSSFVNYETFPKGFPIPILVYFKETQTPSDQWNVGPGQSANSDEAIANGAVPGQVHFFPAICNAEQIMAEFTKRGCRKI